MELERRQRVGSKRLYRVFKQRRFWETCVKRKRRVVTLISLDTAKFVMLSSLPLIETMCQKCRRTTDEYWKMSTSGWRALLKNVLVHRNEKRTWIGIHFLKVLYFFLVGYAILKDFSYLFGAKFTGRKLYRWRHDNWPIGQWLTFHAAPDTAYVNHFFPREFIIWFISIQAKQVDLKTSSLARSLRDLMHWSSLCSLLRTYKRSTFSTSRTREL